MYYKLTIQQREIWDTMKIYSFTSILNKGMLLRFNGNYDYKIIDKIVHMVLSNNKSFNLRFTEKESIPYQFLSDSISINIDEISMVGKNQDQIHSLLMEKMKEPFISTLLPMYRFTAIDFGEGECGIFACIHSLICDEYGIKLLYEELLTNYEYQMKNETNIIKRDSFIEFVNLDQKFIESKQFFENQRYWNNALDGNTNLCIIKSTQKKNNSDAMRYSCEIDKSVSQMIYTYCIENNITPDVLFKSSMYVYLHRVNDNGNSVTIGSVALNRTKNEMKTIGVFESILPLSINICESSTMIDICKSVHIKQHELLLHQKYSLLEMIEFAKLDASRKSSLFDVVVSYSDVNNIGLNQSTNFRTYLSGYLGYTLQMNVENISQKGIFKLDFDYLSDVLTEYEIVMLYERLMHIIMQSIESHKQIKNYKLIGNAEKEVVLNVFNDPTSMHLNKKSEVAERSLNLKNMDNVPIGKPIAGTKIYILNGNDLCGIGMSGELCIAGIGLAIGYRNQEHLTAEKFIDNPFGDGKLYRSGDVARWLEDGNIEYLGRIDNQIKLRGFRIELGEIESALRKQPNVQEAVVIVKGNNSGDSMLCAYVVVEGNVSSLDLSEGLSKELPNYMVPDRFIPIEKLPLTVNGKVDKKFLHDIVLETGRVYVHPRNMIEEHLSQLFREILEVDKVSINDDFFDLGGHSVRMIRLVNRIEAETGIRLELVSLFENPTIELLGKLIHKNEDYKNEDHKGIPISDKKEYYQLSPSQERMYFIQQMDVESSFYNMPGALRLYGEVDVNKLRNSFNTLIHRHEILRTCFIIDEGGVKQKINDSIDADFTYVEDDETSEEELLDGFIQAFDLSKCPLIRMKIVKRKEYKLLLCDMHHIIGDGVATRNIFNELSKLYNGETLEPIRLQYKDYTEWMNSRDISGQKGFWLNMFDDEIPILEMALDYPRPNEQTFRGSLAFAKIGKEESKQIKQLVKDTGATEFMVFLSTIMVVIGRYSRQEDIVIGSPVSGRMHNDIENMLGVFVNNLAIRGKPSREKRFVEFLKEMVIVTLESYENQEYPYGELIENVNVRRDMSRNPLFDVMLSMNDREWDSYNFSGIEVSAIPEFHKVSKFDLTFVIDDTDEGYGITLEYSTDLFKESSANRILESYITALKHVSKDKYAKIKDVELITDDEKEKVLIGFNNTAKDYPIDITVVTLFEEQATKTPDLMALVYGNNALSYKELNEKSNQIAYVLREKGVNRDTFVCILSERSLEMIVGIYGIIKAGGAYIPIDTGYPDERIRYMIEDSNPKVILTYQKSIDTNIETIELSDKTIFEGVPKENLERVNKSGDLIYALYTSGTTGKPKGAMIEHRGVVNLIKCYLYDIYERHNVQTALLNSPYVFDPSIDIIFGALTYGSTIYIMEESERLDAQSMYNYIVSNNIELIECTPSHLKMLATIKFCELPLKAILVGGEKLELDMVDAFRNYSAIYNSYGPTECTVESAIYLCNDVDAYENSIPIGKPISNVKIYILDEDQLCGIGMPGELCIAGDGVARGYLNQDELTNEKFINNPYGEGRLYRSGDLARWLEDGNIEYLGRIDDQVKIRGVRIELGEIEMVLRKQHGVKESVVVIRENSANNKILCGYIVSEEEIDISLIKENMLKQLPEYMIPSYITQIEKIPLTI
ncbi:MAG: amino acid adenylation domain-containing protein, partial [Defluviitaleaceae bacterium]|nr:amino acid adenylation domain-containing protein [Defluviitaleaceae bacterium]